jgi:hypothetical protein
MTPDRDVWTAAVLLVKRYGDDATLEAAARAEQLLEDGDPVAAAYHSAKGALTWSCVSSL